MSPYHQNAAPSAFRRPRCSGLSSSSTVGITGGEGGRVSFDTPLASATAAEAGVRVVTSSSPSLLSQLEIDWRGSSVLSTLTPGLSGLELISTSASSGERGGMDAPGRPAEDFLLNDLAAGRDRSYPSWYSTNSFRAGPNSAAGGGAGSSHGGAFVADACGGSLLDEEDEDEDEEDAAAGGALRTSSAAPSCASSASAAAAATARIPPPPPPPSLPPPSSRHDAAKIVEICESRIQKYRSILGDYDGEAEAGAGGFAAAAAMSSARRHDEDSKGNCKDFYHEDGDFIVDQSDMDYSCHLSVCSERVDDDNDDDNEEEDDDFEDFEDDDDDDDDDDEDGCEASGRRNISPPAKRMQRSHSCNGFSACSSLSSRSRFDGNSSLGSRSASGLLSAASSSGTGSSSLASSAACLSVTSGSGPPRPYHHHNLHGHHHLTHDLAPRCPMGSRSCPRSASAPPTDHRSHELRSIGSGRAGGTTGSENNLFPDVCNIDAPAGGAERRGVSCPVDVAGDRAASAPTVAAAEFDIVADSRGQLRLPVSAMTAEQKNRLLQSLLFDSIGVGGREDRPIIGDDLDLGGARSAETGTGSLSSSSLSLSGAVVSGVAAVVSTSLSAGGGGIVAATNALAPFKTLARDNILGRSAAPISRRPASVTGHRSLSAPTHCEKGALDKRPPGDAGLGTATASDAAHCSNDSLLRKPCQPLPPLPPPPKDDRDSFDVDLARALELSKKALTESSATAIGNRSDDNNDDDDGDLRRALALSKKAEEDDLLLGDDDLEKALELSKKMASVTSSLPPVDTLDDELEKAMELSRRSMSSSCITHRTEGIVDRRSSGGGGREDDDLEKALELSRRSMTSSCAIQRSSNGGGCGGGEDDDLEKALDLSRRTISFSRPLSLSDGKASRPGGGGGENGSNAESLERSSRNMPLSCSSSSSSSSPSSRSVQSADGTAGCTESAVRKEEEEGDDELETALRLSRQTSEMEFAARAGIASGWGHDSDGQLARAMELSMEGSESDKLSSKRSGGGSCFGCGDAHDDFLDRVLPRSFADVSLPGEESASGLGPVGGDSFGVRSGPVVAGRHQSGEAPSSVLALSGLGKGRQSSASSSLPMDEGARRSIVVRGAGAEAVNGRYNMTGKYNGAGIYTKDGLYCGRNIKFTLYRCNLVSGQRKWFISIVPEDSKPGTSEDRNFYVAPDSTEQQGEFPPDKGWASLMPFGQEPAPMCWQDVVEARTSAERRTPVLGQAGSEHSFVIDSSGSQDVVDTHEGGSLYTTRMDAGGDGDGGQQLTSVEAGRRRWFLSAVPEVSEPGSGDADLHVSDNAPAVQGDEATPPLSGRCAVPGSGLDPSPVCSFDRIDKGGDDDDIFVSPPLPLREGASGNAAPTDSPSTSLFVHVAELNGSVRTRKIASCVVCRSKPVTHVLIPCGHPCLCEDCSSDERLASMCGHCPKAGCEFHSVMRFYGTLVEE